jgi:hypothetical protein
VIHSEAPTDRKVRWEGHRKIYNYWLVGAGLVAFAFYCTVAWTGCSKVDEFEITAFTAAFQAIGYLLAMAIANVCYFLGPVGESAFRPKDPERYRKITFGFGVAFSVALPMLMPVTAFISVPRC